MALFGWNTALAVARQTRCTEDLTNDRTDDKAQSLAHRSRRAVEPVLEDGITDARTSETRWARQVSPST